MEKVSCIYWSWKDLNICLFSPNSDLCRLKLFLMTISLKNLLSDILLFVVVVVCCCFSTVTHSYQQLLTRDALLVLKLCWTLDGLITNTSAYNLVSKLHPILVYPIMVAEKKQCFLSLVKVALSFECNLKSKSWKTLV